MKRPAPREKPGSPSGPSQPARRNGETEKPCLDCARRLHQTLEQEALVLKKFSGSELLPLIATKEFQVGELGRELARLKDGREKISLSGPLRDVLTSIERLNRSNRLFVQSSLAYWQELLSILCPAGYGPGAEAQKSGSQTPKGLSFSREI